MQEEITMQQFVGIRFFWAEVEKRNQNYIERASNSTSATKHFNNASDLPLPDLNENQEFLASYSIVANTEEKDANDDSTVEATNVMPF
jgi:hypothetical protein